MAGTVTLTKHFIDGPIRRLVYDCTGDAADGTFPSTALPSLNARWLQLLTNPGSTAPTDNYDIALTDDEGADRLNGAGANRDTANSEIAPIVFASTSVHPVSTSGETLSLAITNSSVNSATIKVVLFYEPL